jgi:hypothetical protein
VFQFYSSAQNKRRKNSSKTRICSVLEKKWKETGRQRALMEDTLVDFADLAVFQILHFAHGISSVKETVE